MSREKEINGVVYSYRVNREFTNGWCLRRFVGIHEQNDMMFSSPESAMDAGLLWLTWKAEEDN